MKKIFIDLDMTLNSMSYDWCTSLGISPKDVSYFGWVRDALGVDADAWWAIPGIYDIITPLPGADYFLKELSNLFKIVIITHTHSSQNPHEKDNWIAKYFSPFIDDIIHASEKYKYTKDSILIDDNPRHCYDHVRTNLTPAIIFNHLNNYGWAKPFNNRNIIMPVATTYHETFNLINMAS